MFQNKKFSNKNSYLIISNFENVSEKDCIKMDSKNDIIYQELLSKARKAEKTLRNSALSLNLEVPSPPVPSNRERLILWKKRNIKKHVIEQSESVLFLKENGYELYIDYEAYQAIELAKDIKRKHGIRELPDDKSKQFNNIFTENDNNILRRKSFIQMNDYIPNNSNNLINTENFVNPTNATQPLYNISYEQPLNNYMNQPTQQQHNEIHSNPKIIRRKSTVCKNPEMSNNDHRNTFISNNPNIIKKTIDNFNNITTKNSESTNCYNERIVSTNKPSAPPISHNVIYPKINNYSI